MGLFSCFGGQPALVETIEQPNKKHDAGFCLKISYRPYDMVHRKSKIFHFKIVFGSTYDISEQNKVPKSMTRSSVRKSLKVVNLAGNDIEKIDSKFWLNTNLEEVNLSENKEIILKH